MEPAKASLPIQICEPRCYVIQPSLTRMQAITRAGAQAEKTFGIKRLFRKSEVTPTLIERRLVPFWFVRCKSHFHYDRMNSYKITPQDEDALEITIQGIDDRVLTFPMSQSHEIILHGIERCVTDREVSEVIDAYDVPESKSLSGRATSYFRSAQKRLTQYLSYPRTQGHDLATLYQESLLDGQPLYEDLEDEKIRVLLPREPANRVVGNVMKKVMVSIEPVAIHDWLLTIDAVDLYLRPVFVFQFERADKEDAIAERKFEQLDALTGDWTALATTEVLSSNIPWEKILVLTMDASAVVFQELSGPWLKVTAGLLKVGSEHLPGIMDDIKGSRQ